ncbi:alpha/beta fold hydrolase [Streptomyces pulveraceus]|uniref:Alpha/beta hydrolase n=1 Tax=Streptomyces pulveraceus TaxID=68258 RepID=A0ABW1GPN0_9ACTN
MPVTPSGIGERAHLSGSAVNLDTHIQDVLALLASERVTDAVLVGHSNADMVITGVVDRAIPCAVRRLVYGDAYVPQNGDSCRELTTEAFRRLFVDGEAPDGFSVQPSPGLGARATANPLASFLQRLTPSGEGLDRIVTRDYVFLSGWAGTSLAELYQRPSRAPEWRTHVLDNWTAAMTFSATRRASSSRFSYSESESSLCCERTGVF